MGGQTEPQGRPGPEGGGELRNPNPNREEGVRVRVRARVTRIGLLVYGRKRAPEGLPCASWSC